MSTKLKLNGSASAPKFASPSRCVITNRAGYVFMNAERGWHVRRLATVDRTSSKWAAGNG